MQPRKLAISITFSLLQGSVGFASMASAQMIPITDNRYDSAEATYQGVTNSPADHTPGFFAAFDDQTTALAERYQPCDPPMPPPDDQCLVGQAGALSFQNSQFFPAGIQFSGGTSGSWGIPPSGSYGAASICAFTFMVATTFDYQLYTQIDPGDLGPSLDGGVTLYAGYLGYPEIYNFNNAIHQVSGRLGPGTYTLHGYSSISTTLDQLTGPVYFAQWLVTPVPNPIIDDQPDGMTVGCGGTATFAVSTTAPPSGYTYQWRRNQVPLTNSAHISGATSNTLVIHNACTADAGQYDVVVTGPPPGGGTPLSEPSAIVTLGIVSNVTGVETNGPPAVARVRAASPNPFHGATSITYESPRAGHLRATVYSVTGAKVRTIRDGFAPATGSITWDGRGGSGAPAPKGIYFIQVEVGGVRETRKVVLAE